MKKMLLSVALAATASVTMGQGCIELFVSEYVEGWGNNKAIELYNPTSEPKNLSNYMLARYSNGSGSADANQRYVLPNEIIEPYSTYVIVLDKRNPDGEGNEQPVWIELQALADHFANPVYNENNCMYFNGNDAMVLSNVSGGGQGFPVDVFGRIGEDPAGQSPAPNDPFGWNDVPPAFTWINNGSVGWTKDHSLIRKFDVTIGNIPQGTPVWNVSLEWDSIPPVIDGPEGFLVGNWGTLGWHDCECFPLSSQNESASPGALFPNPVSAGEMLRYVAKENITGYQVFDLTGKLVDNQVIPNINEFEINTAKWPKGMYLLRTYGQHEGHTLKFVVQ